ncbi:recombinase family protein [Bacillus sp. FJAT-22090]|uniref:recombinase family protein n=1 Tax=Bacillus sp. FJAT-22090 TaxID=1581038 RepID=UPI0011A91029|nr:recombinase family protein [Bacillus sp. FJAT-22090]
MQKAPFGYKFGYVEDEKRFLYIPDENTYTLLVNFFIAASKFQCLDELANNLNEGDIRTPNGLPYSKSFITSIISNPIYINLLEIEWNCENRYIVYWFESLVTLEEWVLAQVAIENWDVLRHPDIREYISS